MKTYLVGGAVRDALLGHPGADRDWVVVGGTPEELAAQLKSDIDMWTKLVKVANVKAEQ